MGLASSDTTALNVEAAVEDQETTRAMFDLWIRFADHEAMMTGSARMMKFHLIILGIFGGLIARAAGDDPAVLPAPTSDRVEFPTNYARRFEVLRAVNKPQEQKVVRVYGNAAAASVTNSAQLPYPYGSILVMETARAVQGSAGEVSRDSKGDMVKGTVTGLHVMRRERGFGAAYERNRSGEWEFVEYKPDGTYITPPRKSASCAECHVKAGAERDFVYKARLGNEQPK
jgi:hypothetical protein